MPSLGPGLKMLRADPADCHQPANLVRVVRGEVDADSAAHRVADDVDPLQAQFVDEGHHRALRSEHRVTTEVVADAESGELQDETAKALSEGGENTAKIAPPGDPGSRSVQEQQRRAFSGLVITQDPVGGWYLTPGRVVTQID